MGGWVKPQLNFFFKWCVVCVFFVFFYVSKCFQKNKKMNRGVVSDHSEFFSDFR